MKRIYTYILMPLAALLGLSACQEYEIDSQPEGPLSIRTDAMEVYSLLATAPSRIVFNISSNTPWSIESDSQWCTPDPAMSAASSLVSEITVTTEDNIGKTSRTATLTIRAEGIESDIVITVNQAAKESLTVIPYDGKVATEGETVTFTLASNKPWEIIPSTAFLSDIDKKSGQGNENGSEETISITVPANPGAKREGTITVKTDFEQYTFTIVQNGVTIELEDSPESTVINLEGNGAAYEATIGIRANKDWKATVPSEYSQWLNAQKTEDGKLRISVQANNRLHSRKGQIKITTNELIDGYEGIMFDIVQPSSVTFSEGVVHIEDESTGNVQVNFAKGEMFRTNYTILKGRTTIEIESMQMSAIYNLGFNFTSVSSNGNYKFHMEGSNTYWYRCAGTFGWVAPIKKTYTFDDVNAFRKLDFVVEDDPDNAGKLRISIYINDELYGTQTGRTDIFATGDAGCTFIFEAGAEPAEGDHCIFKSITYIPFE